MEYIASTLNNLIHQTAFFNLTWGNYVMILVACFFLYLAIRHEFEPLLLLPIAFGMLLVNIYPDIMLHPENAANGAGGLLYYFYKLDELAIPVSYTHLEAKNAGIDKAVTQIAAQEEPEADDTELVAVIAAAIAASEGAASTDGFVVRSIRKVR